MVALVALGPAGCVSWDPISPRFGVPSRVRVTTDADRFGLQDARLVGDSAVAGVRIGGGPLVIGLDDVELVEVAHVDAVRTVLLVAGGSVVGIFACAAGVICEGLH